MAVDAQHRKLVSTPRAFVDGQPADAAALVRFARSSYGHFTTMQVRGGAVRGLHLHLARLEHATRVLFGAALDVPALRVQMHQVLAGRTDASLRINVGAANYTARHMPDPARIEVLMLVDPPAPEMVAPVRLMSVVHARYLPQIKHAGGFDLLHLRRHAREQGFDDALLLAADGFVAEGTTFNTGFFDHDALVWPQAPQLDGVTKQLLSEAFANSGRYVRSQPVTLDDIAGFDGGFCCHSGGVWPIRSVDDRSLRCSENATAKLRQCLALLPAESIRMADD